MTDRRQNQTVKDEWTTVWIQPDGPNTTVYRLGCANIDSVTDPRGSVERTNCYNPVTGKYEVTSRRIQAPDAPTLSVEELTPKIQSYMERVVERGCPAGLYVNFTNCPPRDTFNHYDRSEVYEDSIATQITLNQISNRESGQDVMDSVDWDLFKRLAIFELGKYRRTTSNADPLRDIAGCGDDVCGDGCGAAEEHCDNLWAVGNADGVGGNAPVLYSTDGGITWAQTAADPFAADEDINSVVCFPISEGTWRVVVMRGTTDAANPGEVAYSDDGGATWTTANLGAVNANFGLHSGGLCNVGKEVWAVDDQGDIYYSSDGAETFADQVSGNAVALRYIRMIDRKVGVAVGGATGASQVCLYTVDGGLHWTSSGFTSGPGATVMANCVAVLDESHWFVGFENGDVYYTRNQGAAWAERAIRVPASGTLVTVDDIYALDRYVLFLAFGYSISGPAYYAGIQRSRNGGMDWDLWTTPDALDDNSYYLPGMYVCHANRALAVGNTETTSYIFEVVNTVG